MRVDRVQHKFVEFVPEVLEYGVLYISIPYGAVVHRCFCGCGEKVSTPLSPAQWKLTYDGEAVTLSPSVGNGTLPCNSHYYIRCNRVEWALPLTRADTVAAIRRDAETVAHHYAPGKRPSGKPAGLVCRGLSWFRRYR